MNRLPWIIAGVFLSFASSWLGLVVYPFLALGHMQPVPDEDTGGSFPPGMSGLAVAGQRVYAANGCLYCHSQQVRPAPLSTDIEKGRGPRRSVARDSLRAQPAFLGTMRTGPDLTNIGARQPDAGWHHRHLFDPRSVAGWSIMPPFRFLYKTRQIQGQPSDAAVHLTGPHAPPAGYEVVPTDDAKALVAYLLSLQSKGFDPAPLAGEPAAQTVPVDPKILGRRVYTQNCQVCHQATGLGIASQFPPLAGSEWVLGQDWHGDNHLVKIVLKGLQGPIQVQGKTFNNAMPTWSMLTDGQIANVLTYIRSEWGNAAPPIFEDYVRAIREQTPSRTEPWAPKDLQAIPAENAPPATACPSPVPPPSPAIPSARAQSSCTPHPAPSREQIVRAPVGGRRPANLPVEGNSGCRVCCHAPIFTI